MQTNFVIETTRHRRRRLLILGTLTLLAGMIASVSIGQLQVIFSNISTWEITPFTIFVLGSLSGLFFFPVPIEALFYVALESGNSATLTTVAVMAGFILGNVVSYLLGWKLSRVVMGFAPPKKLHAVRRYVVRWGVPAVFVLNLIPFPSPLLTFGLGIARYHFTRLFSVLVLANFIKFLAIVLFSGFI